MTVVEIRERGVSPNCRQKAVGEASPWARRDKTDWSNEVRSSWVPRIRGASEWRMGQWATAPVGPKEKKDEYCHNTECQQQCLKCQELCSVEK